MGVSVNILTSGFLVTVIIFFLLMGILYLSAYSKMGQVLLNGDSKRDNLEQLDSALNSIKIAYILAFIGAGVALLLAILYAGHELVIAPSEYFHLVLYLACYVLLIVSVIYAYIALTKIYDITINTRNGADAFIWAGLLMSIFAFVGLTATGSGRLGMNIIRSDARNRITSVENKIHTHLPAIKEHAEQIRHNVETHLPHIGHQVNNLHNAAGFGNGVYGNAAFGNGIYGNAGFGNAAFKDTIQIQKTVPQSVSNVVVKMPNESVTVQPAQSVVINTPNESVTVNTPSRYVPPKIVNGTYLSQFPAKTTVGTCPL